MFEYLEREAVAVMGIARQALRRNNGNSPSGVKVLVGIGALLWIVVLFCRYLPFGHVLLFYRYLPIGRVLRFRD